MFLFLALSNLAKLAHITNCRISILQGFLSDWGYVKIQKEKKSLGWRISVCKVSSSFTHELEVQTFLKAVHKTITLHMFIQWLCLLHIKLSYRVQDITVVAIQFLFPLFLLHCPTDLEWYQTILLIVLPYQILKYMATKLPETVNYLVSLKILQPCLTRVLWNIASGKILRHTEKAFQLKPKSAWQLKFEIEFIDSELLSCTQKWGQSSAIITIFMPVDNFLGSLTKKRTKALQHTLSKSINI